jgi:hypothetical protein
MPVWYHNTNSRCRNSYLDEGQLYETEILNLMLNSTCIGGTFIKNVLILVPLILKLQNLISLQAFIWRNKQFCVDCLLMLGGYFPDLLKRIFRCFDGHGDSSTSFWLKCGSSKAWTRVWAKNSSQNLWCTELSWLNSLNTCFHCHVLLLSICFLVSSFLLCR